MKNYLKGNKEDVPMTQDEKATPAPQAAKPPAPAKAPAAAPVQPTKTPAKSEDEIAAEKWHAAAQAAPGESEVTEMRTNLEALRKEVAALEKKFATATATRACVFGFQRVADEQKTTAKQIHAWRREYTPNLEDLSSIPDREMKREERRIAALDERLRAEAELKRRREEHQARLDAFKKAAQK